MKRNQIWVGIAVVSLAGMTQRFAAAAGVLQEKDVVAVCGDSITEQKLYSMFIETYLLACKPKAGLTINQFGWSGEVAPGFAARIGTDVLPLHPTIATTCYGMNDGHYTAMSAQTAAVYRDAMKQAIAELKAGGVRTVVVGGPGCVDSVTFKRPNTTSAVYNQTLLELGKIAADIAKENGFPFADVHGAMMQVMAAAKDKYGEKFPFAGSDGVHPEHAGHLVMAYAYLKAMGCDGNIGTITLDVSAKHADASDGHTVISFADGVAEIESTRMPFCFLGDGKSATSELSVAGLFPFNADLNRFTLVVKNLDATQAKVTWGNQSKTFSADQLATGINLADEFIDDNPFTGKIGELEKVVSEQQAFETTLTKVLLHGATDMKKLLPDGTDAVVSFDQSAIDLDAAMCQAVAKKAATPVRHTIKVEAVH